MTALHGKYAVRRLHGAYLRRSINRRDLWDIVPQDIDVATSQPLQGLPEEGMGGSDRRKQKPHASPVGTMVARACRLAAMSWLARERSIGVMMVRDPTGWTSEDQRQEGRLIFASVVVQALGLLRQRGNPRQ